ncbi:MAG: RidA family protein [Saprospiraceae bacterium]|nr:RidA family protein [Candidatus Opimibacter skivensis]
MKKAILTTNAPAPIGPYSQAIQAGDTIYISGQIAIDPSTGDLITSSIEEETHQVLKNVGAILEAAGLSYENVVSCSVFIKDMELFGRINAVYTTYFSTGIPPARALVQVSDLPKHVNIEISAIAHI